MEFEEKQVSSQLIFDGHVLHVYKDDIQLTNGKAAFREYVRHIGAVCVVPLTKEREVICVRQYRYPLGRVVTEIPAGKLDSREEDRQSAVLRELREETGAICGSLTYLGRYYASPAILDECISMYLAEDLTFGETDPDDDEFLEIVRIPLEELCEKIACGEIEDGKTQAAVLKTAYVLSKRQQNK